MAALKEIPGYLDITPGDFATIYRLAYRHALARQAREITAAQIMTREVVAVPAELPVPEVAAVMGARGISGLPVVNEHGAVIGVISEKDFLRLFGIAARENFLSLVATYLLDPATLPTPPPRQTAGELMSAPPLVIQEHTTLQEIAGLFADRGINRAPVVDASGKLVGIVSRADLLKALSRGDTPC